MILRVQYWLPRPQLAHIQVTKANHQPYKTEADCDNCVNLRRTPTHDKVVDDAYQHPDIEHRTHYRSDNTIVKAALFNSRKGHETDDTCHTIEQEGANVGDKCYLRQSVNRQYPIRTNSSGNDC